MTATTRLTSASVAPCRITISTATCLPPDGEPVTVPRRGDRPSFEPRAGRARRVRSFYRWVEVRQDEPPHARVARQLSRLLRRQMNVDRLIGRQRALVEQ